MDALLLSGYQALQLLALGPCLFMVFFLCVAGRRAGQILVPVLYFLSLSCNFLLPLSELLGIGDKIYAGLQLGSAAEAAVSFLLIVQCMTGQTPPLVYWSILALPVLGGGQLIYASVITDKEICLYENICTQPFLFQKLYDIFSISLTCLLTVIMYRRLTKPSETAQLESNQKYGLAMALVMLNLLLLGIDFTLITHYAEASRVRFAETIVHIGFIYLTLTLMFRMFDRPVELAYDRVPHIRPAELSPRDQALTEEIQTLFVRDRLHRDPGLDREKIARKLAVTESNLSRIINRKFQETTSSLVNRYRIEEAKGRLLKETTAITTIAFEVGFASIPSFNRVFRQMTGMSPSQYRAQKALPGKET